MQEVKESDSRDTERGMSELIQSQWMWLIYNSDKKVRVPKGENYLTRLCLANVRTNMVVAFPPLV